jgi:hypothetical protein
MYLAPGESRVKNLFLKKVMMQQTGDLSMASTVIQLFAKLRAQFLCGTPQTVRAGVSDLWHSALKHTAECQPPLP